MISFKDRVINWITHPLFTIKNASKKIIIQAKYMWYRVYYGRFIILLESHCPFDGNSGALFNYMKKFKKYKRFTYVWIINGFSDGSIINTRRILVFSFSCFSLKKQWLINHAKYSFFDDIPVQAKGKNAKTVYLGHGCPLIKNVKGLINLPTFVDSALCTSKNILCEQSNQINIPIEKMFVSEMPRNDVLFQDKPDISSILSQRSFNKVILWLPTFRKSNNSDRCDSTMSYPFGIPIFYSEKDFADLDDELKQTNIALLIKSHPIQDLSVINVPDSDNIFFLSHQQLLNMKHNTYTLLACSDALISDYSSVVFDYMLIDRPIAYTQDDKNKYTLGFMDNYERYTPGFRINGKEDFIDFIRSVYLNIDDFVEERKAVSDYIHDYKDGNNCKRVLEYFGI